uniref:Protein phosphatase inhibitor 2 n=1 Tax=Culex tarsalis TaxID=7177 RepID=A0A1Q3F8Z2_CULTA
MSLNADSPDAKKPCKGILKSSSSFDKRDTAVSVAASASHRKSAKFDELNVLQTYHPPDKDYGHMKVDEPKTPYNYVEEGDVDQLDAELLAEKLRVAASSRSDSVSEEEEPSSDEEQEELTEEERKRRGEFERRRKAHYNEFEAVKLARKLIEEEDEDDEEGGGGEEKADSSKNSTGDQPQKMEVEDLDEVDRKNGQAGAASSTSSHSSSQPEPAAAGIVLPEADEV